MAFALASAASASALKKGFSGEGTIIAISFFCCATAGIAPAVSKSVGIASSLTMDFQFRGLFVGIAGLDLGWGLERIFKRARQFRARARVRPRGAPEQRSYRVLEYWSDGVLVLVPSS